MEDVATEHGPGFYEAIGRTIQVLRTDQGLSRKDLADKAGISYSYLSAIETGGKPPSSKILFAIAAALGVRSHELLAAAEARTDTRERPPLLFAAPRRSDGSWFGSRSDGSWQGSPTSPPEPPRTDLGALAELHQLLPRLSPEDIELVVGMARRLAGAE